tara:strand:+ start:231 stop:740 length:510 start_codon:yes stop_codon:yes gene_type:complete
MKTYKQFQESVTKALKAFGSKGIRKAAPNVEFTEFGKTTKKFVPDIDLKQFNRTQDLKNKYKNLQTPSARGRFMQRKTLKSIDDIETKFAETMPGRRNIPQPLNVDPLQKKLGAALRTNQTYADRRYDEMSGLKPPEYGYKGDPGKGNKARRRAIGKLSKVVPFNKKIS